MSNQNYDFVCFFSTNNNIGNVEGTVAEIMRKGFVLSIPVSDLDAGGKMSPAKTNGAQRNWAHYKIVSFEYNRRRRKVAIILELAIKNLKIAFPNLSNMYYLIIFGEIQK
jgi:hypothetical protein